MYAKLGAWHCMAVGALEALRCRRGQGTVEYVGLILMIAVLMGGMVTALGGVNGLPGKELAEAITDKIIAAVKKISFSGS